MAETEAATESMEIEARRPAGDEDEDHVIPDSANPTTLRDSKSDSDTSSDSDSDDDGQLNLEVQTLEAALSENPSDYDSHVNVLLLFTPFIFWISKFV